MQSTENLEGPDGGLTGKGDSIESPAPMTIATAIPTSAATQEENYDNIGFFIEGVHRDFLEKNKDDLSASQRKEFDRISAFGEEYKCLCKENDITSKQAEAVAAFFKTHTKQAVMDANTARQQKEIEEREKTQKYASENIGNDEYIANVHQYASNFFKERGLAEQMQAEMKNPKFLHVMSEVRKALVGKSEVERALNPSIIDKGKLAEDFDVAIRMGDTKLINAILQTAKSAG